MVSRYIGGVGLLVGVGGTQISGERIGTETSGEEIGEPLLIFFTCTRTHMHAHAHICTHAHTHIVPGVSPEGMGVVWSSLPVASLTVRQVQG